MFRIARFQVPLLLTAGALLGYAFASGEISFKPRVEAAPRVTVVSPGAPSETDLGAGTVAAEVPLRVALQKTKSEPKETAPREPVAASGWIGIMLETKKGEGLRVVSVFPGGPAAFAGLRTGDVLEKIGATAPASIEAAIETIEGLKPQQQTSLTVRRDGKPLDLKITVGNLMEFHGHYSREMSRRDPRDPNFGLHHGVSEADISVEVVRRIFEQNQRLDTTLNLVLEELHGLRKELRARDK